MPSASGFPLLFGHFVGTARPSDFPSTCMLDFWIMSFSNRPAHYFVSGVDGTSLISRVKFSCMQGVYDRAQPNQCSRLPLIVILGKVSVRRYPQLLLRARACGNVKNLSLLT